MLKVVDSAVKRIKTRTKNQNYLINNKLKILNIYNWAEMIDLLPHKFLKLIFNADFFFFENNANLFLKLLDKNSSEDVISFALLNIISNINPSD